jgi:hypothetical protein
MFFFNNKNTLSVDRKTPKGNIDKYQAKEIMSTDYFDTVLLGNPASAYLLAIGIFIAGIVVANIVRWVVLGRLKH